MIPGIECTCDGYEEHETDCDIILQRDYAKGLLRSPCDCLGWELSNGGHVLACILARRAEALPRLETRSTPAYRLDYLAAVEAGEAPDYGPMLNVIVVSEADGTEILAEFGGGRYLSLYQNSYDEEGDCYGNTGGECEAPGECEGGWCGSDRFQVGQDCEEWLDVMSTCGIAGEWDWVPSCRKSLVKS